MNVDSKAQKVMPTGYMKLEQAARQALEALNTAFMDAPSERAALIYKQAITALREALAEQAECPHGVDDGACKECYMKQAEQEPVAWVNEERNTITWDKLYQNMTPLYAAPVRTKDLTDDEIIDIDGCVDSYNDPISFARAVIAADREKNK